MREPLSGARLSYLDGIRGIAAAVVAIFHYFRAFTPQFLSPESTLQYLPISALWNGHFAVEVFFVLSGFLFFSKYYKKSFIEGLTAGIKRYFRLSLPVLGASLVAWGLHSLGLFRNSEAAKISGSDWLNRWYLFNPDIELALKDALFNMYWDFDLIHNYNGNLWTISYELFAIWLIIALASCCRNLPIFLQVFLLLFATILTSFTYVFAFVVGAILVFVRNYISVRDVSLLSAIALTGAGLSAGAFHSILPIDRMSVLTLIFPIAAALILFAADSNTHLQAALTSKPIKWLGTLSFGVYLIHFVTINSIASATYLATSSVILTFFIFVVVTLVGAIIFERYFDRLTIKVINYLFSKLHNRSQRTNQVTHSTG